MAQKEHYKKHFMKSSSLFEHNGQQANLKPFTSKGGGDFTSYQIFLPPILTKSGKLTAPSVLCQLPEAECHEEGSTQAL